jgi:5,10-methylenetetrahydromethanopterin reductase
VSAKTFGVELFQYTDAHEVLRDALLAEELGFASVWLGDSQLLWREVYVLLGAVAARTERIALATGVTNPLTRHPSVTASAAATLQELSGGRAILGIGAGFTAVRMLGWSPASRATLTRFVSDVRALCEGEPVDGESGELRLAFGAPGRCPPIVLAAAGPRMLRLAGEIADGVIVQGRCAPDATLDAMIAEVRAGRRAAGRESGRFLIASAAAAAVHADRRNALDAVKSFVSAQLLNPLWPVSDAARQARDAVRAAYGYADHMSPETAARFTSVIPDEVVPEFALAGTPEECRAQARALFAAGIDEITLRPYAVDGESRGAMMETLVRELVEPLRGS